MDSSEILGRTDIETASLVRFVGKNGNICDIGWEIMSIISYVTDKGKTKPQIDKLGAFCTLLNDIVPPSGRSFNEIIEMFDASILQIDGTVSREALSNCHGDWYEWLLAIAAWNFACTHPKSLLAVRLPNIAQFDVASLYGEELAGLLRDLREKLKSEADVELITSNPDFVILDRSLLGKNPSKGDALTKIDKAGLDALDSLYLKFVELCSFDSIKGYVSAKISLRPDRRLQLSHEGSLMKALYAHLQTRLWIINPAGIKYYVITSAASQADIRGLKTVATHSITTVQSMPQAAVDKVFIVDSLDDAAVTFDEILLT